MLLGAHQLNTCMLNAFPVVEGAGASEGEGSSSAGGAVLKAGGGQADGLASSVGGGVLVVELSGGQADGEAGGAGSGSLLLVGGGQADGEAETIGHGYRRPHGLGPDALVTGPFLVDDDGPVARVGELYIFTDSAPRALVQSAF